MLLHPSFYILISTLLLIFCYRTSKIFNIIAVAYPLICCFIILKQASVLIAVNIFNIRVIIEYLVSNQVIAIALLLVTLAANIYAIGQHAKKEIITAAFYCAFTQLSLFAGDFLSLFASLEAMVIFASLLMFLGTDKQNVEAAKRYFLTHLFSGSLILIGISYIISAHNSTELLSLTSCLQAGNNIIPLFLMLAGLLINIAAFPFSGWMISCYPASPNISFIYLLSFTTKINLIILIKLFSGLLILKYFGIILALTSVIYACKEENIKRILCYLSLTSSGFVLIGISLDAAYLYQYLFIEILTKAFAALLLMILAEKEVILSTDVHKLIQYRFSFLFIFSIVVSSLVIISTPFITSTAYIKYAMTLDLKDRYSYYAVSISSVLGIFAVASLFTKSTIKIANAAPLQLNWSARLSLCILLLSVLIVNKCIIIYFYTAAATASSAYMQSQLSIFIIIAIISYFIKLYRINTTTFNFDLLNFSYSFFHYILRKKAVNIAKLQDNNFINKFTFKIDYLHNQNISFFIVFNLLIILILILNTG